MRGPKMALFQFLEGLKTSPFSDFWRLTEHEVPDSPGVYVLAARSSIHYRYPSGNSPIFYIGQAKSLRARLRTHYKFAMQSRDDRRIPLYWPRYEFAAKHGGRYCYIKTWRGLSPKSLEDLVLARFAKRYLSFPIANARGLGKRCIPRFPSFSFVSCLGRTFEVARNMRARTCIRALRWFRSQVLAFAYSFSGV